MNPKTYALFAMALAASGCASLEGKLDNRVVCTLAGDKAYALSEYGPISVGSRVADEDRQVICKKPT